MNGPTLIEYGLPIGLTDAKAVVAAAEREAVSHGLAVIIVVVDSAAQLVALERLDHAQFGSIEVAIAKAQTAVRFKRATKAVEEALAQGGLGLRMLTVPNISAIEGGIPLLRDGKIVGAIGVAGMLPPQDVQVAQAGAEFFHRARNG